MSALPFVQMIWDTFGTVSAEDMIDIQRMPDVRKAKQAMEDGEPKVAARLLRLARSEFRLRAIP